VVASVVDLNLPPLPNAGEESVVVRLPVPKDKYDAEWAQEMIWHIHVSNPLVRYVDVEWEFVTLRYDFGAPRKRKWWKIW
jgi:hypothetical protein